MIGKLWHDGVSFCQRTATPYVLLTVMGSVGSTPRDTGSKMVVCEDRCFDTIGGGHLEFSAIQTARQLLLNGQSTQHVEHYPLAAKLAQCCGGATHVLFEVLNTQCNKIVVFGAGHVAKALIPILSQLQVQVDWVDQRAEMFESAQQFDNVTQHLESEPQQWAKQLRGVSSAIIMTHDHQLDLALTQSCLAIEQMTYVGVIGSQTKAKRFYSRLERMGVPRQQLAKLVCPIGMSEIPGKLPIEVAVSIAAQIIQQNNTHDTNSVNSKTSWQQTKHIADLL